MNKTNEDLTFDPHDDRPFVKDLLKEHAEKIECVRQRILQSDDDKTPLWDPKRYDELWILRFLMSNKYKVKEASKAALKTMKFRHENKLNELGDTRHLIKNYGVQRKEGDEKEEELPYYSVWNSVCGENCITISQPDPNRGIMVYMDVGRIDIDRLMGIMTKEEMKEYRMHATEASYQVLDEVTRRTGRLTKITQILDESNVSLLKVNRKAIKQDADISKEFEDYYPQALSSIYIFNAPSWVNALWAVLRPIFPKRLAEKIDFVPAAQTLYKPLLRHVSEANLPERFGGKNKKWPLPSVSETLAASKAL